MAKPDKDKPGKSRKTAKPSADSSSTPKKPNLLKRIVKTIESFSKDKQDKSAEQESRKSAEASRKQSLDQAVEELNLTPAASIASPAPSAPLVASIPPPDDPPADEPEPESEKKKPKAEKKKSEKPESGKDSKKSVELMNKVIIEPPPISHVYGVSPMEYPTSSIKAAKFDIEPPHPPAASRKPVAPIALADQIFSTRLVLLVRDPELLYAYWDVRDDDRRTHKLDALLPPRHLALRLYDHGREAQPSAHPHVYVDYMLQSGVDSRYLKLPLKDRWWRADLGIKDEVVGFTQLARSNTVRSPRDQVADWGASARPLAGSPSANPAASGAANPSDALAAASASPETIFQHTFRLSGGVMQSAAPAGGEITESHTVTKSVLRVRPVGSSALTAEEELESLTTLKVRNLGASDLTSRQS